MGAVERRAARLVVRQRLQQLLAEPDAGLDDRDLHRDRAVELPALRRCAAFPGRMRAVSQRRLEAPSRTDLSQRPVAPSGGQVSETIMKSDLPPSKQAQYVKYLGPVADQALNPFPNGRVA